MCGGWCQPVWGTRGSSLVPILQGYHAACPHLRGFTIWTLCAPAPPPSPAPSLAGGCQALPLGRAGCHSFLPASRTHCSCRQRRMDFWFQGVIHPGPSIRPCCHPLSSSPLLISVLGCGGEAAVVKGPLVKIKITPLDRAPAPGPTARGCARVELYIPGLPPTGCAAWPLRASVSSSI